jgi:hypothetical protein
VIILSNEFAGLGQFISSNELDENMKTYETVEKVEELFKRINDGRLPNGLIYNSNAKWLVGIKFKPVPFLDLAALYQDEYNRYGIYVKLSGDKAGTFKDISGDFSYEKRKGSVGRFTGAISLPQKQRRVEMGVITIIVPEVALDLYRNGDFKIDVGFPVGLDFSRSLCIEALPYVGWGGFYFARLSAETSVYSKVPKIEPTIGFFSPIVEAGLAVNLGYGKFLNRGVLNAGLSLTGIGILEGTNATFNTVDDSIENGEKFSWYKGTLGLSGKVFGNVDLVILRAEVDCEVNTKAEMIVESHRATKIDFELVVEAHGEIEVNFGFRKGKVSKGFNDKMDMEFEMGSDTKAPWDTIDASPISHSSFTSDKLVWSPVIVPELRRFKLRLYFMPQLSISEDNLQKVQCSAMLYMINQLEQPDGGFKEWVKGLMLWTLNAYLNRDSEVETGIDTLLKQEIFKDDLKKIECWTTNGCSPINYNTDDNKDIVSFISNYFDISICPPDLATSGTSEIQSFVFFPMFPDIKLTVEEKLSNSHLNQFRVINFAEYNRCSDMNLKFIKKHSRQMLAEPFNEDKFKKTESEPIISPQTVLVKEPSMATFWIQDVITLCVQAIAREASDLIGKDKMIVLDLVNRVIDNESRMNVLAAMISQFTFFGLRVKRDESTEQKSIYSEIGQQFPLSDQLEALTLKLELLPGDLTVKMNNCTNPPGDTSTLVVDFPEDELERIKVLQSADLPDDDWSCVRPLTPYVNVPNTYPGKLPRIWIGTNPDTNISRKLNVFSSAIGQRLAEQAVGGLDLYRVDKNGRCKLEKDNDEFRLVTFVEVSLLQTSVTNLYELKGVSGYGQLLLERLVWAIKNETSMSPVNLESVHVLHLDPNEKDTWVSGNKPPMIFSGNLSRFTEPPDSSFSTKSIQDPKMFAQLLYTSSIIRSGGFYLWCENVSNLLTQNADDPILAQIVFRYTTNAPLAAYINAADTVIGPDPNESYYFLDSIQSKKPAFPSGHAGIEVYRPLPAAQESIDQVTYLRRMFHLIGTKLEENLLFDEQPLSDIPIAPVGVVKELPCVLDSDPSRWPKEWYQYRSVLPIAKYAKKKSVPVDCDQPTNNPYEGLGGNVNIILYPRDGLGNTLENQSYSYNLPVRYRDFVVPAHQWPGTNLSYRLDQDGLIVYLTFSTEGMTSDQVCAAKESYALAFHQLSQDHVEARLVLSIDEETKYDVKSCIIDYVLECWRSLCKIDSNNSDVILPVNKECKIQSSAIKLNKENFLFELTVELTIIRESIDHIDTEMQSIAEAVSGVSRIPHESTRTLTESQNITVDIQSIEDFAIYFESAFNRKLAKGAWRDSNDGNHLWVVDIGEFTCLKIERQADTFLYAAAPLETVKRSRTLTVQPYASNEELDSSTLNNSLETEYVEDLDDWVQKIFSFIDEMFEATNLSVIGQLDGAVSLEKLREAKKAIATAYVSGVKHLGNPKASSNSDLISAREQFKQQMFVHLTEAYKQDTVIQQLFNVEITCGNPAEMSQVNLYGPINASSILGLTNKCDDEGETPVQATFTTAKLSLQRGLQYLTYLFDTKNSGHYTRYKAIDTKFKVTHLEYTSTDNNFIASSYISLIIPYEIKLGNIIIPVAIKGHPEPPLLMHHDFIDREDPEDSNAEELLDSANKWKYAYMYKLRNEMSSQDRIKHEIVWNEKLSFSKQVNENNLPQSLAQLIHVIPDIRNALKSNDTTGIWKAIDYLINGITQIASNLITWWRPISSKMSNDLLTTFDILEQQNNSSMRLELVLDSLTGPISISDFSMKIGKYNSKLISSEKTTYQFCYKGDEGDEYLLYDQRMLTENEERYIFVDNINVFEYHIARVNLFETRNEKLLKCCDSYDESTAEEFVYRTQKVSLTDPIIPRLRTTSVIDFSTLSGATEHTIEEHVNILLKHLFKSGGLSLHLHSIVCHSFYKYTYLPVQTQLKHYLENPMEISVPICLKHAFAYSETDPSIEKFCEMLNDCLKRKDGPVNKQGRFIIKVSIYPGEIVKENMLPMLIIDNLTLPLKQVNVKI